MANELNIQLGTGLTVVGSVWSRSGVQQGSDVNLTEVSTGQYSGAFSLGSIADGQYLVKFEVSSELYGFGDLYVRNNVEVSPEMYFNAALDQVTTDSASRTASKADVSNLDVAVSTRSTQTSVDDVKTAVDSVPTASQNADAVWSKTI
jgi:hypothetical protein